MTTFGERIRKLRRDRDIMQGQLAEYLGIKSAAVSKWEKAENAYPNVDTLIKLADYFNVSTDYLLRGIRVVPVTGGGNVTNSTLNSSVVQNNVQSNVSGGIVVNGQIFSKEAIRMAQIYDKSENLRGKNELLSAAFRLEDEFSSGKSS